MFFYIAQYPVLCQKKKARVTRADRRRMVELREETGVQRSLTERLVRSRLQWAGHVERMADDRWPITEESGRVTRAGQEETREAEMGGLCKERCEEGRRGGRLEEEDTRQSRVEKNSKWGSEKVAGITSPLTKGKRGRERSSPLDEIYNLVFICNKCFISRYHIGLCLCMHHKNVETACK